MLPVTMSIAGNYHVIAGSEVRGNHASLATLMMRLAIRRVPGGRPARSIEHRGLGWCPIAVLG